MAEDKKPEEIKVGLISKDFKKGGKGIERSFPIGQANKLLNLSNSQWKLNDKGFTYNGKEIAKAKS